MLRRVFQLHKLIGATHHLKPSGVNLHLPFGHETIKIKKVAAIISSSILSQAGGYFEEYVGIREEERNSAGLIWFLNHRNNIEQFTRLVALQLRKLRRSENNTNEQVV